MSRWARRAGFAVAALAMALSVSPAAAKAPHQPVRIAGTGEFDTALPYGKSKLLLFETEFSEDPRGIERVNRDGSVDDTFGDEGTVKIEAKDVAVAPDGKILVATNVGSEEEGGVGPARVTRLLPDGTVDRSFCDDGSAVVGFGRNGYAERLALAPDGDVLVAGIHVKDPGNTYVTDADLTVARLKPDGSPDPSFGKRGVKVLPVDDEIEAMDIAPTPSGGVLVEEGWEGAAFLKELNRDGSIDRDFGHGGVAAIQGRPGKNGGRQLSLVKSGFTELPDGKILVKMLGSRSTGASQGVIERFRADGRVDPSWGKEGWAVVPGNGPAAGLAPLRGGAIAVATNFHETSPGGGRDFGAIALDRHGRPDREFGTHGSCRARLPKPQKPVDVVAMGGEAVALGSEGSGLWLLACR